MIDTRTHRWITGTAASRPPSTRRRCDKLGKVRRDRGRFIASDVSIEPYKSTSRSRVHATVYRAVLGARRHSRTRPIRLQTNHMAERFIGTLPREWADPDAYHPAPSASPLSRSLSTSTISAARTRRSADSHPWSLSITSAVTPSRPRSGCPPSKHTDWSRGRHAIQAQAPWYRALGLVHRRPVSTGGRPSASRLIQPRPGDLDP
jgi:hypothetical protein